MLNIQRKSLMHVLELLDSVSISQMYSDVSASFDTSSKEKSNVMNVFSESSMKNVNSKVESAKIWIESILSDIQP